MSHSEWTVVHDRAFERALVIFPENIPNRWEKMKQYVPGNWSPEDLKERYRKLEHDVFLIQSGQLEFPKWWNKVDAAAEVHRGTPAMPAPSKKGTGWTEEEHRLFLLGLEKCGKGDWRRIARQFVVSRTSTQVASHAQKYFLRQNASKKERKRKSIHDITTGESDQNLLPLPRLSNQHNSAPHPQNQTPPAQNWVPPSDVDAQQLLELQRALQQAPAEMVQYDSPNWIPPSDVDAQQLRESQRALQQAPVEMVQYDSPNNLHQQMGGFGQFNNNFF